MKWSEHDLVKELIKKLENKEDLTKEELNEALRIILNETWENGLEGPVFLKILKIILPLGQNDSCPANTIWLKYPG